MTEPPQIASDTAAAIYQAWLDVTSQQLLDGDVTGFASHVALPFVMRTIRNETMFENRDQLSQDMQVFTNSLRSQGVTHYIRLVKKARFLNDAMIEGLHTTYMLRDAVHVVEPYGNRMVLRHEDEAWRVIEAEHELANQVFPVDMVRAAPGALADKWATPNDDIRAHHANALPIYRAFIDAMTETTHQRDPESYCSLYDTPLHVHHFDFDLEIAGPSDIRDFYDAIRNKLDEIGDGRLVRQAQAAEFIASDRIVGYHVAWVEKDGTRVFGPIQSRMIITLRDESWRCISMTNSVSGTGRAATEKTITDDIPTLRDIQQRMKR